MIKPKLINKNIIISAAADGIGWCITELCLKEGANVFISDIDDKKIDIRKKHHLYNKRLFVNKFDSSNYNKVKEYIHKLKKKIKSIDALINNVGIAGPTGSLENLTINDWCNTINVNINSHFYFTKYSMPLLKKSGGSIFNLSSTGGIFGFPLRTPYAASKWAIIGITKSLAMELGEYNIRVNAICPGAVSGDRMKRVINAKSKSTKISSKKVKKDYESMVSLKKFVNKEDIWNISRFKKSILDKIVAKDKLYRIFQYDEIILYI